MGNRINKIKSAAVATWSPSSAGASIRQIGWRSILCVAALAVPVSCATAGAGNDLSAVPMCCGQRPEHAAVEKQFHADGPVVFFAKLFDTDDFPARWYCGDWSLDVGWLHIISDLAIFAAYMAIPAMLVFFVLRKPDVPFLRIFWLFATFVVACGFGHLVEACIFWFPVYRFAGLVKAFTAIVSWLTVGALVICLPQALALPALAVVNSRLENEIDQRRAAQAHLQESFDDLERFSNAALDREERIVELKEEINRLLKNGGQPVRYTTPDPLA